MIPALRIPLLNRSTILVGIVAVVAGAWWLFAPDPPEVVARDQKRPVAVAAANGTLFWTTLGDGLVHVWEGGQERVVPSAQPRTPAVGGEYGSHLVADDEGTVHWTLVPTTYAPQPNGELLSLSPGDATSRTVASNVAFVSGLAARGGRVFLAADGKLLEYSGGATPRVLSSNQVSAVAADEGAVFWAEAYPVIGIHRAALDGSGARQIAAGVGAQQLDASHPDLLVVLNHDSVSTLLKTGSASSEVATSRSNLPWVNDSYVRMSVAGGEVFLTTRNGRIERARITGGETVTLARRQRAPWGIAVDDGYVYWAEADAGRIRRVPR